GQPGLQAVAEVAVLVRQRLHLAQVPVVPGGELQAGVAEIEQPVHVLPHPARRLASPAWKRRSPPRTARRRAPSSLTPRAVPSCTSPPQSTRTGRPARASSAGQRARKGARPSLSKRASAGSSASSRVAATACREGGALPRLARSV